jgi:hypothetical protein
VEDGRTPEEAAALLGESVSLALAARDTFWAALTDAERARRAKPLVVSPQTTRRCL